MRNLQIATVEDLSAPSRATKSPVNAVNIALGDGIPSRQEVELSLVGYHIGGDWNPYLGRMSFDFRSVESREGVYLRGLRV